MKNCEMIEFLSIRFTTEGMQYSNFNSAIRLLTASYPMHQH